MKKIIVGCGAGYAGDRIDPAVDLAQKGNLDYLVLECLAERTTALAQIARKSDPLKGYGQFLGERMKLLLPLCKEKGFRIVTNIGAANPEAALKMTVNIAKTMGLSGLKIAALLGADVLKQVKRRDSKIWETEQSINEVGNDIVSADAYLGAQEILPALVEGADVIITGRVADPSLFLAPMIYEFGWGLNDWNLLGKGTVIGHLLECSSQVSGGYFADPVYKEVEDLAHVGFPIAEVKEDGSGVITKLPDSGGLVSVGTCKEQLLYEIHDPGKYLTPDVSADFTNVSLEEIAPNRVSVKGGGGTARPEMLKVTLGLFDGYIGEGTICYGGHHAVERAKMAQKIVEARFVHLGLDFKKTKYEIVGINSLHGTIGANYGVTPYEVMLRVTAKTKSKEDADKVGNEVESLWLSGPGGPGGARKYTRPVLAAYSTLIPRDEVEPTIIYEEVS